MTVLPMKSANPSKLDKRKRALLNLTKLVLDANFLLIDGRNESEQTQLLDAAYLDMRRCMLDIAG